MQTPARRAGDLLSGPAAYRLRVPPLPELAGDAATGYKEAAMAGRKKPTQYRLARFLLRVGGPVGLGELTELFGGEPQPLVAVLGELKATGAVKELGPVAE